jgi:Uma2 family endonuclease
MEPARRRATYEDLLQVPEHMVAEILDGELYASPRPALPHARATSAIGGDLWGPFDRPPGGPGGPGGWWILDEPELHLGPDVVVPGLAGWRRERVPRLPNAAYFDQAPDWACEVVSPASGAMDRRLKMPIYAREGVSHLWLVDPVVKTLEVYGLEAGRWVVIGTYAGAERVRAEPFAAIDLDLSRWWLEE